MTKKDKLGIYAGLLLVAGLAIMACSIRLAGAFNNSSEAQISNIYLAIGTVISMLSGITLILNGLFKDNV